MEAKDADALDCDFAEYYGVTDRQTLPLNKAAAFALGLPPESRSKRRIHGAGSFDLKTQLLAMAVDRLGELVWTKTKDALRGRNKPKSVLRALLEHEQKKTGEPDTVAFESPEAFERARAEMIKTMNGGSV